MTGLDLATKILGGSEFGRFWSGIYRKFNDAKQADARAGRQGTCGRKPKGKHLAVWHHDDAGGRAGGTVIPSLNISSKCSCAIFNAVQEKSERIRWRRRGRIGRGRREHT